MAARLPMLLCLLWVGASCAAVIDADSPSPSSQKWGAAESFSRHMETLDDLMNAFAQETKTKDELRCHCNLPVCVTTGYMCKSAMGTCFSEIVDRSDLSKSRHGCLELLSSDSQTCHNNQDSSRVGERHRSGSQEHQHNHLHQQKPLVLCCQDDLCNYGAQQVQLRLDSAVQHNSQGSRNDSSSGIEFRTVTMETRISNGEGSAGSSHDLWLKAATIAVPIAGGCILVLLVLLAIRMLRRDRENNMVDLGGNYALPAHRNDFQIRTVWGKSRQIQPQQMGYHHVHQQQMWKDRQPMLSQQQYHQGQHQSASLLHAPHNIVYLPTVQKIIPPKRMWNKSCILAKNSVLQHV